MVSPVEEQIQTSQGKMLLLDSPKEKRVLSLRYNSYFNKETGFTARWGITEEDDPEYSPPGPELLDIEISSSAENDLQNVSLGKVSALITDGGCSGRYCKRFCYKRNIGDKTVHMSLDTLKKILDKMSISVKVTVEQVDNYQRQTKTAYFPTNKEIMSDSGILLACHLEKGMWIPEGIIQNIHKYTNVCQIAYGICGVDSHPQLWDIFAETRSRGIIPNVTINGEGITTRDAEKLAKYCGAVAISVNRMNKETAYDTVKLLSQTYGMSQINFHFVIAQETLEFAKQIISDIKTDARLSKLNAIVFLSFKDKGKTNAFSPITQFSYNELVEYCTQASINYGFDSCAANLYLKSIENKPNYKELANCAEPCESGLFSAYINYEGKFFACSFSEGIGCWEEGMDVLKSNTFMDIWNSEKVKSWRNILLKNKRNCPIYQIGVTQKC